MRTYVLGFLYDWVTIDSPFMVAHEFSNIEIDLPELTTISKADTNSYLAIASLTFNKYLKNTVKLVNFTAQNVVHDVAGVLSVVFYSQGYMEVTNLTLRNIDSYTYSLYMIEGGSFKFKNVILDSKSFN